MKRITLPRFNRPANDPGCCLTPLSREFLYGPSDSGCCAELNLNWGAGSTESYTLNFGPTPMPNTCEAVCRFTASNGNITVGDYVILNVQGTDYNIPINSGFIDIPIPAGFELLLTVFAQFPESPVKPTPWYWFAIAIILFLLSLGYLVNSLKR